MDTTNKFWGVKIIIFKVLIIVIIFAVGLKQYTFRIQQNFKCIDNSFYKFIKKLCFVSDKYKQKVCRKKIRESKRLFLINFCQYQNNIYI